MSQRDITFGLQADGIGGVRDGLSEHFQCSFELRYSDYLGGDYYLAKLGGEEIRVQWNRDGDDIAEEDFPDATVLVLVDGCSSPDRWNKWAHEVNATLIRENVY